MLKKLFIVTCMVTIVVGYTLVVNRPTSNITHHEFETVALETEPFMSEKVTAQILGELTEDAYTSAGTKVPNIAGRLIRDTAILGLKTAMLFPHNIRTFHERAYEVYTLSLVSYYLITG